MSGPLAGCWEFVPCEGDDGECWGHDCPHWRDCYAEVLEMYGDDDEGYIPEWQGDE
jgi:hypothetical protein